MNDIKTSLTKKKSLFLGHFCDFLKNHKKIKKIDFHEILTNFEQSLTENSIRNFFEKCLN